MLKLHFPNTPVAVSALFALMSASMAGASLAADEIVPDAEWSRTELMAWGIVGSVPDRVVKEVAPGCSLDVRHAVELYKVPQRARFEWDGACAEGADGGMWATGTGRLTAFRRADMLDAIQADRIRWFWNVRPDGGVRISRRESDGLPSLRVAVPEAQFSQPACNDGSDRGSDATLDASLETATEFAEMPFVKSVFVAGTLHAREACGWGQQVALTVVDVNLTMQGLGEDGERSEIRLLGRVGPNVYRERWTIGLQDDPSEERQAEIVRLNAAIEQAGRDARQAERDRQQEEMQRESRMRRERAEAERERERRVAEVARREREEAISRRRSEIEAEIEARVENDLAGSHPIENVAEIYRHDRIQAMRVLSQGRQITLVMTAPTFQAGKVLVSNNQTPTDVEAEIAGGAFSWNSFMRTTGNPERGRLSVTCVFDLDQTADMVEGESYAVNTTLTEASDDSLIFDCSRL